MWKDIIFLLAILLHPYDLRGYVEIHQMDFILWSPANVTTLTKAEILEHPGLWHDNTFFFFLDNIKEDRHQQWS